MPAQQQHRWCRRVVVHCSRRDCCISAESCAVPFLSPSRPSKAVTSWGPICALHEHLRPIRRRKRLRTNLCSHIPWLAGRLQSADCSRRSADTRTVPCDGSSTISMAGCCTLARSAGYGLLPVLITHYKATTAFSCIVLSSACLFICTPGPMSGYVTRVVC